MISEKIKEKIYSLSEKQKEFFHFNGYLIVEKVFSEKECDLFLEQIRPQANEYFAAILNPDQPDFLAKQAPHSSKESILKTSAFCRNTMKDGRLISIIKSLQGEEIVGLMSQMLFKEAGSRYAQQAWNPHQDNSYPRSPNHRYMTTNLFFANADRENGSLYIYPGSHREEILPAQPTVSYRENFDRNPGNTVVVPKQYVRLDLKFQKGDLLILHGNVIHGSYPNLSKTRSRPLYSCSYITKGEEFIPGDNAQRRVIPLDPRERQ